jgi:hypothetical protein
MQPNDTIKRILLDILRVGLLRIRAFGNSGLSDACSIEADHLHNLPMLVWSLRWDELLFYYNVERPAFLNRTEANTDDFRTLWSELEIQLQAEHVVAALD